jgi:hypothetical protein
LCVSCQTAGSRNYVTGTMTSSTSKSKLLLCGEWSWYREQTSAGACCHKLVCCQTAANLSADRYSSRLLIYIANLPNSGLLSVIATAVVSVGTWQSG